MKKIAKWILKSKWVIIAVTFAIVVASVFGLIEMIQQGKINSDIMSYFDSDADVYIGLQFLKKNFGVEGDSMIVVEGTEDDADLREKVERIRKIDGITQLVWYEDIVNMARYGEFLNVDTSEIERFFKVENDGHISYVLMMTLGNNPSSKEAYATLDAIKETLAPRALASAGMTEIAQNTLQDTLNKLPLQLIVAMVAIIIILFAGTSSFFEPVILLSTLAVAVIVNMGTNIIFPSISIISFATSGLLQLALTMDYAIFYMHDYKRRREYLTADLATMESIPSVASSIMTSAMTTVGGFAALYFMKFKIGADIAMVLMKGVGLSLLSVIILQPILVFLTDGILKKSVHKEIKLKFKRIVKFAISKRVIILGLAVLMIVPLFIAQGKLNYSYFQMYDVPKETIEDRLAAELGNQLILAVPLDTKEGYSHKGFIEKVKQDERGRVTGVMGAFAVMDVSETAMKVYLAALESNGLETLIETSGADVDIEEVRGMMNQYFCKSDGKWYTLYTIAISGDIEDGIAIDTYRYIAKTADETFGEGRYYELGSLNALDEMIEVTPKDFTVVTILSIAIIMVVLMLQFRSFRKSILLVLIIEFGILVNFAISALAGEKLNFMIYIIISSVQLGCTVDYAILMANTFESEKWCFSKASTAVMSAASKALPAVISSASIIAVTCMAMYFTSGNIVLRQLSSMIARGAALSLLFVALFQPGIMIYFREMKSYREMYYTFKNFLARRKAIRLKKKQG